MRYFLYKRGKGAAGARGALRLHAGVSLAAMDPFVREDGQACFPFKMVDAKKKKTYFLYTESEDETKNWVADIRAQVVGRR